LEGKYRFDLHFILQEKDAAAGDYIVRARGAWFGNRSISAEVDLEPGIYEVVPKIEARRDPDAPDVHEVVTKLAERNPQKLRQIGISYDLANARGLTELDEQEREQKKEKRRKADEKKKAENEAADKEKAEFETWKKEKDEFEAWKREKKQAEEKAEEKAPREATHGTEHSPESVNTDGKGQPGDNVTRTEDPATAKDSGSGENEVKSVEDNMGTKHTPNPQVDDVDVPGDDDQDEHMPPEDRELRNFRGRPPPRRFYREIPRFYRDAPSPGPGPRARSPVDTKPKPWNAVCVLGLRVHSQDSEVTIKLVRPKNVEEGAILDVGGDTAAGATM
jgi:hypothetical protein